MRLLPRMLLAGLAALLGCATGCAFGPRALERSHSQYNESIKQATEEQLLANLVHLRYNDDATRLDVTAIAAQFALDASLEARPFNSSQAARVAGPPPFATFSTILPFVGVTGSNRPTITYTPLNDPDTIRGLFRASSLDGIIFLAESGWPVATVFRLWVDYLNRVPNAIEASGPPRGLVPRFEQFQAAVTLLQVLQDRGAIRFVRKEKITEIGSPLPAGGVTAAAQVEAARNGYEYQQRPDRTWVLIKRYRRLELSIDPAALGSPELLELCRLLHLRPGLLSYDVTVGSAEEPQSCLHPEGSATINLYPRSTIQALFYMAHGVVVPVEHLNCGVVQPTLQGDDGLFDWQQVLGGLFTVHSVKQRHRPKQAWVAVKYRGYWFYIDDRDNNSKITFTLMMVMARANLLGVPRGGPTLTLPVGR
jgi:hypothetical protein